MSPCFVLGRENVPCVTEEVNRSLKADCIDFTVVLLNTGTPGTNREIYSEDLNLAIVNNK